jgi:hypothetical protein
MPARHLGLVLFFFPVLLQADESSRVTIQDKVVGKTPQIIGINTGEMPADSAFPEWVRALGVNGARLRLNADPDEGDPKKISSFSQFESNARRLRSSAKQETPKLWQHPSKLAAPPLRALREDGIELLATITCPFAFKLLQADGKTNWANAWKYWAAYYAESYQLATQHQIRRYQLFNEPNHKESAKLTQEEYSVRMAVGTDAIQAALADVGKDSGVKLEPLISAPCTAGISIFNQTGKPEARDDKIGWGELSMRDRHLRIDGRNDSAYTQFQQYAVQHYSANPVTWLEQLEKLGGLVRQANAGRNLPMVMSEFNIHTARDFAQRNTTLDSPEEFSDVGSMGTAIAESGLEELYFFRLTLSKNLDGEGVKKNGVHHVNEDGRTPEITGTTRAAEIIRLAASTLRNQRDVLETKATGGLRAAATRQNGDLRVLLARTNATTKPELDIALPNSPSGSLLTWEIVTADAFGTTQILDNSRAIRVSLPSTSVGLLSVRPFGAVKPTILPASSSFSTDTTHLITGGGKLDQTLFQFSAFPSSPSSTVFLHLQGKTTSGKPIPIHLYSITGKLPPESDLKSGSFSFRKKEIPQSGTPGLTVEHLGHEIEWVGGFTFDPAQSEVWVEITSAWIREPKHVKAFLLARDLRQKGDTPETDPVEWQSAELVLYPR